MKRILYAIKDSFHKMNYILTSKQKRLGIVVIILVMISPILETLGVSAILPFIESLLVPEQVMDKWYAVVLKRLFGITETQTVIIAIGICIILIYIMKNAYLYLVTMIHTVYRSKVQRDLSTKMLRAYMDIDYEHYTRINTAEIQRGIGVDVTGVYNYMDNLFRFLGECLTGLFIALFLVKTDVTMACGVMVIAGLCFGFIILGLKKKTRYYGEMQRKTDQERGNCSLQAIGGFKEIKVSQSTDYFVEAYRQAYERQRVATVKNEFIANLPERMIETVCVGALLGIVCVRIACGMDVTTFAPKLAVFAVAAFRLLPAVSRMTRYMNGIIFNQAFMQGVYDHLVYINSYIENTIQKSVEQKEGELSFKKMLEMDGVYWKYQNSQTPVLDGLTLQIEKGQVIGLMGASGAGKSTLVDVLLGLLRPEKGQVLSDGMSIFDYPKAWSRIVGYVPQSIYLTDDTIRANVGFGCAPGEIDDEKVWSALKEAQLDEFVRHLPEQLDTQVGERGIKFSGGQRQRIAIARALYYDPSIMVLDEATSALDHETEEAVMAAIDALHGQKTLIIVAHRLTTLRKCDAIYEIKDGKATLRKYQDLSTT